MSKKIDSLVIIGHSHMIASEAPHYSHEDIQHGLSYVRNGKTSWNTGRTITEKDIDSLYASEVFLDLGALAASLYTKQFPMRPKQPNPFREIALDVLNEISPFETDDELPTDLITKWPRLEQNEFGLPEMFDPAIAFDPSLKDELQVKWAKAQMVHARRGKVAIMAYDTTRILHDLSRLDMSQIAPDEVKFGDNLHVKSQSYNLGNLVGRTDAQAKSVDVPYYQTFSNTSKNGAEMLASALEDIQLVSAEIR